MLLPLLAAALLARATTPDEPPPPGEPAPPPRASGGGTVAPVPAPVETVAPAPVEPASPQPAAEPPAAPPAVEPASPPPVSRPGPMFHPDGPGPGALRLAVGAQVDVLPRRIVQSEQRQLPQLTADLRVGLPFGFAGDARLAAIALANQVNVGVSWTAHLGPLAVAVQDHQGLWFGFAGMQGFDATDYGWQNRPGVALGFAWRDVFFSISAELIWTFGQHVRVGTDNLSRGKTLLAGGEATITVENPLASGHAWYFGLGVLDTTPNYEVWLAFSDFNARVVYPRFFGGYVF